MKKIEVMYLTGEVVEYDSIDELKADYNILSNIDYSTVEVILVTSGRQSQYQYLKVRYLTGTEQWYQQLPFTNNYQKLNIR